MILYKTIDNGIFAVKVKRETKSTVVFHAESEQQERYENKSSSWYGWHDTWADAHAFLIAKAEEKISELRARLEQETFRLGQIRGMKPD